MVKLTIVIAEQERVGPIPHQDTGTPVIAQVGPELWVSGYFDGQGLFFGDDGKKYYETNIVFWFEIPDELVQEAKNDTIFLFSM